MDGDKETVNKHCMFNDMMEIEEENNMRYAIKTTRGIIVFDIKLIKEYGNHRPDKIMVNGSVAERISKWDAIAPGNELYYEVDGKTCMFRQDALRDCEEYADV